LEKLLIENLILSASFHLAIVETINPLDSVFDRQQAEQTCRTSGAFSVRPSQVSGSRCSIATSPDEASLERLILPWFLITRS
jgi:hypothetical protein